MQFSSSNHKAGGAFWLEPDLRARLEPLGTKMALASGEVIFRQRDECRGVFMLTAGDARIAMANDEGRVVAHRKVEPGSLLGVPATLCREPYMFTAESVSDCSFTLITADAFQEFLRLHPEICMTIVQLMSRELAVANRTRVEPSQCQHLDCSLRGSCSECE